LGKRNRRFNVMATVTPNFNWPVPTSTDLVKDGATAIEALGDSIDASLVDLKGGTTGQVLSKASGTDMDFSWVTSDDANAIQNSIVNAKGDLIGASANDTPAILSVGNNGETLVADSSTSTGLRYQAPVNVNPVLNSAFQCWQRGTSFAGNGAANTYAADRWKYYNNGTSLTVSRQTTGDTTNLPNIQYCTRVARNNGATNTNSNYYEQSFETINSIAYAGKTVTFSFYARKGANYSTASSNLYAELHTGTGTDQDWLSGYTGDTSAISQAAVLTTTWQRFSYTATLSASMTEMAVVFASVPVGTAGAADYFEVTGVQIEVGSVATPFKTYAGTIQGELAACQRYYVRTNANAAYAFMTPSSGASSTSAVYFSLPLPVEMRVYPTAFDYGGAPSAADAATRYVGGTWAGDAGGTRQSPSFSYTHTSAALTQNRPYRVQADNNVNTYLGFSAEL
jgi:hypothetical protein